MTCTHNSDCAGKGACAEAPDQPVTCGYWCRCGDGMVGCGEQCDDGNVVSGDGCDDHCRTE